MTIQTSDLSAVMQPVATAKGLPNAHYVDPHAFDEERKSVLFANWSGVGFAKDVPNEGDAKPVDFLGVPLLILRDHDGAVRVYQNTCRHRGMILIDKPGNIRGTIRCPYHSWCYSLDGRLRSTPHVGGPGQNIHPEIKRNELGLIEIRSHVWLDVVYVNISGQAADFNVVHAELVDRWAEFDKPLYHSGADSSFTLDVNCNWKLAVENYCESYHLPWVHPGLNSYSRLEDHYNIQENGRYSGQGTLVYRQLKGDDGIVFPDFSNLTDTWDTGAEYITVFPNVLLGVHRDHTFAIVLEPKEQGKTQEHVEIYYASEHSLEEKFADIRAKNSTQWKEVFKEDIFVVEGMQKGRNGPFFDGGKFSPAMDGPTHVFHEWVAQSLSAGRQLAAE
ncbi:aromatic ring-hydroxylating dioxygenase subunit alpha [Roseobacter sp. N2S]|uniref:aromatic ring-hydroxylating oxygenase subunit alpha n=1 Tax=Roseobacter sp. N2S TaxID=2663844 RepID=UPI0028676566|nr:aromatic ring-hydroxylating dioxygenase subunit alpha [Roseobacter sp. N2S]MDR6264250.1 phenylpropionate dioxygenase-like ring-hydroxylating dioxygenase large terminal subunit [Roseobacter sp. N2S]